MTKEELMEKEYRNKLAEDNLKLVYLVRNQYFYGIKVADEQDFIGAGFEGLARATITYDNSKYKFSTYACKCISNSFQRHLKKLESKKRKSDYLAVSLDETLSSDDDPNSRTFIEDLTSSDDGFSDIYRRDILKRIENIKIKNAREVCELRTLGYSNREIGEMCGVTKESIKQRVKAIRKHLNKMGIYY